MLATNASGINSAKQRTLIRFLLLYGVMCVVILSLVGTMYYQNAREQMISAHRLAMQLQSETYVPQLKQWLEYDRSLETFPQDLAYATALYGYDQKILVGNIKGSRLNFKEPIAFSPPYIHLIVALSPYGMGEFYLVFEAKDEGLWKTQTIKMGLIFGGIIFLFLLLVGYLLFQLLLRPINDTALLLDNFIKDTTHELNTPISAILTNIEILKEMEHSPSIDTKLRRIEIASRTISTLYDDLTYLILNHNLAVQNEPIEMGQLLMERLEYFRDRIEQKKLSLASTFDPSVIWIIDRTKAIRLIDNLLSNAIKYNRMEGSITLSLTPKILKIEDTGVGIPPSKIQEIFQRYARANTSVGGFGIGLHIVSMIAKEYLIRIEIDSILHQGTTIQLHYPDYN